MISCTALTEINIYDWTKSLKEFPPVYFNDFRSANVLPAALINFKALEVKGSVVLEWAIENENNNSHFSLERSTDGENFTSIGTVEGMGISKETQHYVFTDKTAPLGSVYYQLVQFNIDRILNVSNIIHININRFSVLKIYDYKSDDEQTIDTGECQILLKNSYGKIIFSSVMDSSSDKKMEFCLPDIPSGIYTLCVIQGDETHKAMLVK